MSKMTIYRIRPVSEFAKFQFEVQISNDEGKSWNHLGDMFGDPVYFNDYVDAEKHMLWRINYKAEEYKHLNKPTFYYNFVGTRTN